jgi:hypothetical protein
LVSYSQKYDRLEANADLQFRRLNDTVLHWHLESEHEAQVAIRNSDYAKDEMRRCSAAEYALRQPHHSQAELRVAIDKVEQEALNHVRFNEQNAALQLSNSEKYTRLLKEEIFAKDMGMQMAKQKSDTVETELARVSLMLAHGEAEVQQLKTGSSDNNTVTQKAQRDLVQSLSELQDVRAKYDTALSDCQEAMVECESYSDYGFEENRLYIEHYNLWQTLLCSTQPPSALPPGLPAAAAGSAPTPLVAPTRESRYDDPVLKIKEADKLHAPAFPTITNLASWQSNLTQALVQTSGVRDVETIIAWISAVWAAGSKIEDFADSGGEAYVTLDVKLSIALQQIITHNGPDAKELK